MCQAITKNRIFFQLLALAGASLWLVTHPYRGLFQDANLYTLMALRWLEGAAYARDPFFVFGAQDAYSVFSPIHGVLIRVFGVSGASTFLVLIGGFSWLSASWLVARRIFSDRFPFGVFFLCSAALSLSYSPVGGTFVLNESFATARIVAIPLGIAAVALGANRPAAWLLALFATALHPLLGVWPLLLLASVRFSDSKLAALAAIAFCSLLIAAVLGRETLFHPLSAERLNLLRDSTVDLLVSGEGANAALFWLAALLVGSLFGAHHFRRCYLLIAFLSALAYLLSLIASLYYPIELLLQVQPWRAMWLAIFFAVVAIVDVAWVLCRSDRVGWCYVLLIGSLLLVCKPVAGPLLFLGYVLVRQVPAIKFLLQPASRSALLLAIATAVLALPAWLADVQLDGESLSLFGWTAGDTLRGVIGGTGYGVGPMLIVALLIHAGSQRWLLLLSIPMVVWVFLHWDTRAAPTRVWEDGLRVPAPGVIPGLQRGQTVYWPNNLAQTWFGLGTAGYIGGYHLSGLVFSADKTALVVARLERAAVASVIQGPPSGSGDYKVALVEFRQQHAQRDFGKRHVGNYLSDAMSVSGVRVLCADPDLDWVVADFPTVPGGAGLGFEVPWEPRVQHYAYACSQLRSEPGSGVQSAP
ncbi:MAG: hypothetical protein L6Q60_02860 [Rhodocyclaceae bacterium]|nr:hypothetical protein [Rhodocyclaceae bacterium]